MRISAHKYLKYFEEVLY